MPAEVLDYVPLNERDVVLEDELGRLDWHIVMLAPSCLSDGFILRFDLLYLLAWGPEDLDNDLSHSLVVLAVEGSIKPVHRLVILSHHVRDSDFKQPDDGDG